MTVARDEAEAGIEVVDLLVRAGFAASRGEARRSIAGGAVRIDGYKVEDGAARLVASDLGGDRRLSSGKKRIAVIALG